MEGVIILVKLFYPVGEPGAVPPCLVAPTADAWAVSSDQWAVSSEKWEVSSEKWAVSSDQ